MLAEQRIPKPLLTPAERSEIFEKSSPSLKFRKSFVISRLLNAYLKILYKRLTFRLTALDVGIILRDTFEELGVLWVKIAQIMSMRMDLLPREVCEQLAHLQDRAASFPLSEAMVILNDELGIDCLDSHVFADFQTTPFAAASTAQVYRAYLKSEQVWVAVKVQRPNLKELFASDMQIVEAISNFMEKHNLMPWICWAEMIWEIRQIMHEELDYRYEASNMRRMKKKLKSHGVYVPKLFEQYCSPQVIVMEFVQGVLLSDYLRIARADPVRVQRWAEENQIDIEVLGKKILHSYWRQVYEDNLFHGDLHPGNIILLRDNFLAFIDFGSIGFTETELLRRYEALLEATVERRYTYAIDLLLMMVRGIPNIKVADLQNELSRATEAWERKCYVKKLPYDERSFSRINDEWTRILFGYGVLMNTAFLRLIRSFTNMDGALRDLMPNGNVHKEAQKYIQKKYQRKIKKYSKKQLTLNAATTFLNSLDTINQQSTFRLDIIRRMAQVFDSRMDKLGRLGSVIFSVTLVVIFFISCFLMTIYLYQIEQLNMEYLSVIPESIAQDVLEEMVQFPVHDKQLWLVVAIVVGYINISLFRLRRIFRTVESNK